MVPATPRQRRGGGDDRGKSIREDPRTRREKKQKVDRRIDRGMESGHVHDITDLISGCETLAPEVRITTDPMLGVRLGKTAENGDETGLRVWG